MPQIDISKDWSLDPLTGDIVGDLAEEQECELHAENARFVGTQMSNSKFGHSLIESSMFGRCILTRSDWTSAIFREVVFEDCDLSGASFADSRITGAEFIRTKLSYANFFKTALTNVTFTECLIVEAEFNGSNVRSVVASDTDFRRTLFNNLTVASPRGLDIRGCNVDDTRGLPTVRGLWVDDGQARLIADSLLREAGIEVSGHDTLGDAVEMKHR